MRKLLFLVGCTLLLFALAAPALASGLASASAPDATTWVVTTYIWDDGWVEHASWETANIGDAVLIDIDAWNHYPDYVPFWAEFDNVRAFGNVDVPIGPGGLLDDFEDGVIAPF